MLRSQAASNVTGIIEAVDDVTVLLHRHDALACWDYATAAPHGPVDMNPPPTAAHPDWHLTAKDAVFISPHKFPGGPGTPGLLVIKKKLMRNNTPSTPGGGTVFYVTDHAHRYLENLEEREEGGTPNILGAIRCGLVFHLWSAVSGVSIAKVEAGITAKVHKAWAANKQIHLLGEAAASRLPVFSFLIEYGASGRFLHWNYVSTLLSDLFGIQVRMPMCWPCVLAVC